MKMTHIFYHYKFLSGNYHKFLYSYFQHKHLRLHQIPDQLFLPVLMRIYNIFYHRCLEMFLLQKPLTQFPWLLQSWYLFQMETLFPLHSLYALLQEVWQTFQAWIILPFLLLFFFSVFSYSLYFSPLI